MSRIGRQPIQVPEGVEVSVNGQQVVITGPKGKLTLDCPIGVSVDREDQTLRVAVTDPSEKRQRALWGLFRVLLSNMVEGVTKGFTKSLEVQGVGYRAVVKGKEVVLTIGFSHPVVVPIPEGIEIVVEKNVIHVRGIDKQLVGETAARIRRLREPEPYKGTGIRYLGEAVRRKAGKAVKAAGAVK